MQHSFANLHLLLNSPVNYVQTWLPRPLCSSSLACLRTPVTLSTKRAIRASLEKWVCKMATKEEAFDWEENRNTFIALWVVGILLSQTLIRYWENRKKENFIQSTFNKYMCENEAIFIINKSIFIHGNTTNDWTRCSTYARPCVALWV